MQLVAPVPGMRPCADLSHFIVDRDLRAPVRETDQRYIHAVLERSDCVKGRSATRQQVQVPIDFPKHLERVEIFKGWWRDGVRMWLGRNRYAENLVFICEPGPPPYAIIDRNQNELSDR